MAIRVIVFDLDGTLIDSNKLKYTAFFGLFPSNEFYSKIIEEVLEEYIEQTRYVIILALAQRKSFPECTILYFARYLDVWNVFHLNIKWQLYALQQKDFSCSTRTRR